MVGYISEFQYYGQTSEEFVEVALPEGTDPSGYSVQFYATDGTVFRTFPLGTSVATIAGHNVYVVDDSTPGFDDGGADPTGNLHPDDAIALVDGNGNVVQFISYWGSTVTATQGAASGMTSTDVGTADVDESLQSDDGGSTYYVQAATNSGTIPACYGPGTMISTPRGPRPVETLRAGDLVSGAAGEEHVIRWVWSGEQPLDEVLPDQKPVLIRAGAFGPMRPTQDLVVSGQHRIVAGGFGQLETTFAVPVLVPAKALTHHKGVRFAAGKKAITWYHFLCDEHVVVFANGVASETLLLGATWVASATRGTIVDISKALGRPVATRAKAPPALACLNVGEARRQIERTKATA